MFCPYNRSIPLVLLLKNRNLQKYFIYLSCNIEEVHQACLPNNTLSFQHLWMDLIYSCSLCTMETPGHCSNSCKAMILIHQKFPTLPPVQRAYSLGLGVPQSALSPFDNIARAGQHFPTLAEHSLYEIPPPPPIASDSFPKHHGSLSKFLP